MFEVWMSAGLQEECQLYFLHGTGHADIMYTEH